MKICPGSGSKVLTFQDVKTGEVFKGTCRSYDGAAVMGLFIKVVGMGRFYATHLDSGILCEGPGTMLVDQVYPNACVKLEP